MKRGRRRWRSSQDALKVGDKVDHHRRHLRQITQLDDQSVQLQVADKVRIEIASAAIGGYQGQEPVVPEGRTIAHEQQSSLESPRHPGASSRTGVVPGHIYPPAAEDQARTRPQGRRPSRPARADRRRAAGSRPRRPWSACAKSWRRPARAGVDGNGPQPDRRSRSRACRRSRTRAFRQVGRPRSTRTFNRESGAAARTSSG